MPSAQLVRTDGHTYAYVRDVHRSTPGAKPSFRRSRSATLEASQKLFLGSVMLDFFLWLHNVVLLVH
jgi:hypothetical protein